MFYLPSASQVSDQDDTHSPFLMRVLQDLSAFEVGIVLTVLGILVVAARRQLSRLCVLRLCGMIVREIQWGVVTLGMLYLGIRRFGDWGSDYSQTSLTKSTWRPITLVVVTSCVTVGIVGAIWAMVQLIGSSAWFPKRPGKSDGKSENISNQIYVTAPESLTASIEKLLELENKLDHSTSLRLQDVATCMKENMNTQQAILSQLSTVIQHIEGLQMMLPSANFLAFSLDEMSNRIDERLDVFAEIMNIKINQPEEQGRWEQDGRIENENKEKNEKIEKSKKIEKTEKNEKKEKNEKNKKNEKNEKNEAENRENEEEDTGRSEASSDSDCDAGDERDHEPAEVYPLEGWKTIKNQAKKGKVTPHKPKKTIQSNPIDDLQGCPPERDGPSPTKRQRRERY